MAEYLEGPETRLRAILEANYGGGVGFTAGAQALALPTGRLRPAPDDADLEDVLEASAFDRAYDLSWSSDGPEPGPRNSLDQSQVRAVRLSLKIGHVFGAARAGLAATVGSEVGLTAVKHARRRALSLANEACAALESNEAVTSDSGGAVTPQIVDVRQDGATTIEDLGGGRLMSVTPLLVWVNWTQPYRP